MFNKQRLALNNGWMWTLWRFQVMYFEKKRVHFSFTRGYMLARGFHVALGYSNVPYLYFRLD